MRASYSVSYTHLFRGEGEHRDARLHARDPLGGLCGYDRDLRELFRRGVFVETAVGIYERAVLAVLVAEMCIRDRPKTASACPIKAYRIP